MTVRSWLKDNDYAEVDEKIGQAQDIHRATGSKERRSWPLVLCGGKDGAPLVVAGIEFPVLAAAQEAYGKPVTPKAIRKNSNEVFPGPRVTARWPKKRKLARVKTKQFSAAKKVRVKHARAS